MKKPRINLSISIPSETLGAVMDIKKGRSIISLNHSELAFLSNQFVVLMEAGMTGADEQDETSASTDTVTTQTQSVSTSN